MLKVQTRAHGDRGREATARCSGKVMWQQALGIGEAPSTLAAS
jgi:hypothetical protein